MNHGFLIDNTSCIGCHACSTACKSENEVPIGVFRTWVKSVEVGRFPDVRRSFQVTRCNHCANPPCVRICPTSAMHQRPDGIVDFDSDVCIGCKACIQACPYDAIHIDPASHTAAKCHMCSHRVDRGLEPACVVVCPEHAILFGDMDDPTTEIAQRLARSSVTVRKPEQGTVPKLFYIEGQHSSLDPTTPRGANLSYDVHHEVHWGWPIALYQVTKHFAGGAFAGLGLAAFTGRFTDDLLSVGAGALFMLAITLGLLIYDLDRPDRFFFLLVRPQWRSWVARAAWILTGLAVFGTAWMGAEALGLTALRPLFAAVVAPLGVLAATYTAFLFAQAEGRDLWQAPHQILAFTAQMVLLGAAPFAAQGLLEPFASRAMAAAALAGLLVTVAGDRLMEPPTTNGRRGADAFLRGEYAWTWRMGVIGAYALPFLLVTTGAPGAAGLSAALGVFLYAYGWVHAPQTVRNS